MALARKSLVVGLMSILLGPSLGRGAADFLYHERSQEDVVEGIPDTTCPGPQPFVDLLSPAPAQPYVLRLQVAFSSSTDNVRVYYTTDGSNPTGALGTGSNTTQVAAGQYDCVFTNAGQVVDIVSATIPVQAAGTSVRYILGAWHSAEGQERFANGSALTNASQATVFAYEVLAPPVIVAQPVSTTVVQGGEATFTVAATGTLPLTYQWIINGLPQAGATNASLVISNAQPAQAGTYSVTVSNRLGTATSAEVKLTVLVPPAVLVQPQNTFVAQGDSLLLSVAATGSSPLFFQWRKDGADVPDATNAVFALSETQLEDDGVYTVLVTNLAGSALSEPARVTVGMAPAFLVPPASLIVTQGFTAIFNASATGTEPLSYQWAFNGLDLVNQTNSILSLANVQETNAGFYTLRVTNLFGAALSDPAELTVWLPPSIVVSPVSLILAQGQTAQFSVTATGTEPLNYQWVLNETNLLVGATNATLVITNAQASHGGAYRVLVSNLLGSLLSQPALLTVLLPPTIVVHPSSRFAAEGSSFLLGTVAEGSPPLFYQWRRNGTALTGRTNSTLTLTNIQTTEAGIYDVLVTNLVGAALSHPATVTVVEGPRLTLQPVSQVVTQGHVVTFEVEATGAAPLFYRWFFNATNFLVGATNRSLVLNNVQPAQAGTYRVNVSNVVRTVSSEFATLTVLRPPRITLQPASVDVAAGDNAAFTVVAEGDEPLAYQWRLEGVDLLGETNTTLLVTNVGPANLGVYTIFISNGVGAVESNPAVLRLNQPPTITADPASQVVTNGSPAMFFVSADGTAPLFYQWYFNQATPLAGATNATLVLPNVQLAQAGDYAVEVRNLVGTNRSAAATLTVLNPPIVPSEPVVVLSTNTERAVLQVSVAGTAPFRYQWYFEGTNLLAGATNAAWVIDRVQPADAGTYQVAVSNDFGQATGTVTLSVLTEDFGDAPDPAYPTLREHNGPRHLVVAGFQLGAEIDYEDDGQPDAWATGDDLAGLADEDGVRFVTPLLLGQSAQVDVVASADGLLNAWIDFNRNGNWAGPGEQIFTNRLVRAGTNRFTIQIPVTAVVGASTHARFRLNSSGDLSFDGPAEDGEVEDYLVTVLRAVDLGVSLAASTNALGVGGTVTLSAEVTNRGPSQATSVVLVHPLPPGTTLLSSTPSQGTCAQEGGLLRCALGTVNAQSRATVTFSWRATAPGTKTNRVDVSANEAETQPADNLAVVPVAVSFPVPTFDSIDSYISMPESDTGPAFPYPSEIFVSGLTASVYKVTVTLLNIEHTFPDDIDVLLVGPQGQNVMVMSDVGGCGGGFGCTNHALQGVTLTLDDDAPTPLPDFHQIVSGTFRPTNIGLSEKSLGGLGGFIPPAPDEPYGTTLSEFRGTDPNGTWSLFVFDDQPEDTGAIGGWRLTLTLVDPMADLSVQLVDAPDPVAVESNITYTVFVTNRGPAVATGVTVVDPLPAGVEFVSATSSGTCTLEQGSVRCVFGPLNPNSVGTATIRLRAFTGGLLSNTVHVSSLAMDTDPSNNTASTTTSIILVNDLQLAATATPEPVLLGQEVTYEMVLTNRGPYDANGVVLEDILPPGLALVSATASQGSCTNLGNTVRCGLGSLPVGGSAELQIIAQAVALGVVTNVLNVTESEADYDPSNNRVAIESTIVPAADLVLELLDDPDPVVVSQNLVYTLAVTNRGPSPATGITLENALPATVTLVQTLPSQGDCTNDNGIVRCVLGSLQPNAQATVTLEVITLLSGTITNQAMVSALESDPVPENNLAMAETVVAGAADLSLILADQPDPLLLGEPITYYLTVTNSGPDTATGVALVNPLSPQVDFVSVGVKGGSCSNVNGVVQCRLDDLLVGRSVRVVLVVRPRLGGTVTNQASVSANEVDLNPADNARVESSTVIIDTGIFANTQGFIIPESGRGMTYPSTIFVSGVTVRVDSVSVTLSNLSHTYADDLDVLLVGPGGQSVLLMSDAGGDTPLFSATLTFNDEANAFMADYGLIASGIYKPTQYDPSSDTFPAPAPPPPYGTNLAGFQHLDPNGTWSLYVVDDYPKDQGFLGGWSLRFATLEPLADLAVGFSGLPPAVAIGSNWTYSVAVTNRGPSPATGVLLTNLLPAGVELLSYQSNLGSCTNDLGLVQCNLGELAAGQVASVNVTVYVNTLEPLTNSAVVLGNEIDVRASNNQITHVVPVQEPPVLTLAPVSLTVTNGDPVLFQADATGSPPLRFQWFLEGTALAGETNATLQLTNAQVFHAGAYTVRVSNDVGVTVSDPALLTVLVPIAITGEPDSVLLVAGNTAQFQVSATGSEPLTYQWFFNGEILPDSNSPLLVLANVQPAQAGEYQVVISNSLSVATSRRATLQVQVLDFGDAPAPGYATGLAANGARHALAAGVYLGAGVDFDPDGQPDSLAAGDDNDGQDDEDGVRFLGPIVPGALNTIEVVASTNGFLDAWVDFNLNGAWTGTGEQVLSNAVLLPGTNWVTFLASATAVETNLSFARFRFSTTGNLSFDGPAPDGEVEDYPVELVRLVDLVVTITDTPDPVRIGFNSIFRVGVTNLGPLTASNVLVTAQLPAKMSLLAVTNSQGVVPDPRFPISLLGALPAGSGATMTVVALALSPGRVTFTAQATATETDIDPADNSAAAETDIVALPTIAVPPSGQTVIQGHSALFTVVAEGHLLHYQWQFGDLNLPGATNATLLLTNVQADQAGPYSVLITNPVSFVRSSPVFLTVLSPPTITQQPLTQMLQPGETAQFTVEAIGATPFAYQWLRNGIPLPDQTNQVLTIPNAQLQQAGSYSVIVTNIAGLSTSQTAELKFFGPPFILAHPQSRTNSVRSTATFAVAATGTEPLAAQWFFNQTVLAAKTNFTLVIPNVQGTNAGLYHAVVTNPEGSVTSQVAQLVVYEMDFGDAPDPTYPTWLANDGARHIMTNNAYLGTFVDFEADGQANSNATGDDNDGRNDDNGVLFTSELLAGQSATLEVIASRVGYLQGWIDFNTNGSWADPGEQVFSNQNLTAGANSLSFPVPPGASPGVSFARFRYSTAQGLSFTGLAKDGEVEDYAVSLQPAADLALSLVDTPDPVSLGSPLVYTLRVTNLGPSAASGVVLTNQLPPEVTFLEATTTQGTCNQAGQMVWCAVGPLAPGAVAVIELTVLPESLVGTVTNWAQVSAQERDLNLANNQAQAETPVTDLPIIVQQPQSLIVTNGASASFTVGAVGIGPLTYQWQFLEADLPEATNTALNIPEVQAGHYGPYRVRVTNPNGSVLSQSAMLSEATVPTVTTLPASGLSSTNVVLNGQVIANGLPSSAWFLWGTSTNYGNSTPVQGAGSGTDPVALQAAVNGLMAGQSYHYRLVASNFVGTAFGQDQTITWDSSPPVITLLTRLSDGRVRLMFLAVANQVYEVETSDNLIDWSFLGSATEQGGGTFEFLDQEAAGFPHRFYRIHGP